MKVRITKPAQLRLTEIGEYYRTKGNSSHIAKLKKEIRHQSRLLEENPEMGPEEEYLKPLGQGHRYVIVAKSYKLVYLIAAPFIYVTDIFDTRQNPDKIKP